MHSWCKKCVRNKSKEYYTNNRDLCLEQMKKYKKSDKGKKAAQKYSQSEKGQAQQKRWRQSEKGKIVNRRYRNSEKSKLNHYKINKKYYITEAGKEVMRKARKKYLSTECGRARVNKVHREWYRRNRLSNCLSARMNISLKTNKNGNHWEDLVDYTIEELKDHLESLFQPGMSWDNHGKYGWHIDHIIPVSSFNIETYECEDFKRCWSLKNLQPLWAEANLKKGNRIYNNEQ